MLTWLILSPHKKVEDKMVTHCQRCVLAIIVDFLDFNIASLECIC